MTEPTLLILNASSIWLSWYQSYSSITVPHASGIESDLLGANFDFVTGYQGVSDSLYLGIEFTDLSAYSITVGVCALADLRISL